MRIEHPQHGWWMHAIRHAHATDHHLHAPKHAGVRESLARDTQVVAETGETGCDWCDATEQLPERLSYSRYLERQNTEAADPLRAEAAATPQESTEAPARDRQKPAQPNDGHAEIDRRIVTTYQVQIITPPGRYIDLWI